MVRAVGIEPTLCHQNRILSPARLPVPPRPQRYRFRSETPRAFARLAAIDQEWGAGLTAGAGSGVAVGVEIGAATGAMAGGAMAGCWLVAIWAAMVWN